MPDFISKFYPECADKYLAIGSSGNKQHWFVASADFYGVNTPAIANLKLSKWSRCKCHGEGMKDGNHQEYFYHTDETDVNNLGTEAEYTKITRKQWVSSIFPFLM